MACLSEKHFRVEQRGVCAGTRENTAQKKTQPWKPVLPDHQGALGTTPPRSLSGTGLAQHMQTIEKRQTSSTHEML